MSTLEEVMKLCDIKCNRCLDRKYLWTPRKPGSFLDFQGSYRVLRCTKCMNGEHVRNSYTSEVYEGGERLLKEDDSDNLKINMLSHRAKMAQEKIDNDIKEAADRLRRIEDDRIRRADEERQKLERIEKIMNDGSNDPKFGENVNNKFISMVESLEVNMEIGKMIDKVANAIQAQNGDLMALINTIKDIKVEFNMESESVKNSQSKCCQNYDNEGYPVYLLMKVMTEKTKNSFDCIEWCGFFNAKHNITLKYTVMFPKNNAAKKICDDTVSEISTHNLDIIRNFLKNDE